jgi:alpha-tubulin suppressor-like RCC1 family protein
MIVVRYARYLAALICFTAVAGSTVPTARDSTPHVSTLHVSTLHVLTPRATHIDRRTTWRATDVHELDGPVIVEAGGTLVIEAGARIEAKPGVSIDVARDGRVIALGTPLQPIVMTCTSAIKYEGCWGGLTLNGSAAINFGALTSPPARGTGAAGCREAGTGASAYGGCDPADSSGALRYVRIEYASRGLQLLAVGARTVLDFIQVNRSGGDGVSIVGGMVDVRRLFLTANQGYGLSWRSGWRGRGQFITVQQDERANTGGISGSNEGATPDAGTGEPRSAPTLINVTVISPSASGNPESAPAAIHLRRGTSGVLRNVLIHSAAVALDVDDTRTCLATVGSPLPALTNIVIANTSLLGSPDADPLACEPYASPNVEAEWLADPANAVGVITDPAEATALIHDATNLKLPDLRPVVGGVAVTSPLATPPSDGFFDVTAAYIGAVPANLSTRNGIPWYAGWTVAAPVAPLPGVVTGSVASTSRGPLADAIVRAALGRETTTSALGAYTLGLPAGDHLLTATSLPIGCGAAPQSLSLAAGGTSTIDFAVTCNSVASMALGTFHGCALSSAGQAQCWGGNEYGMVGDGTNVGPRTTPVLVAGNNSLEVGTLSSGYTHTCALRVGRAVCWGLNFFGALGVGTAGLFASEPVAVGSAGTPSFVRLSAGGYHSCGLTAAGAAWCWGWNQDRQTGQPTATAELLPVHVAAGPLAFTQITAGESHTCALTAAGEAWCWGGNGRGELGTDPSVIGTQSASPVLVPGGHVFASIDAGTLHTCGITTTGVAYCWGSQEYGQLGNGVVGAAIAGPTLVSGGALYLQISAGGQTTCAVTTARAVHCWGAGVSGALGDGSMSAAQSTPVVVSGGLLAGGVLVNLSEPTGASVCAYTMSGDAYCWGAGSAGQLGTGTLTSSSVPVQVQVRSPN